MGALSEDLESMGYERTEQDSPFDEGGTLWSNGSELVCDETAIVIDGDSPEVNGGGSDAREREYFRYPNSGRIRMIGGFFNVYFESDGLY
jgi:hypothetical protein